MSEAQDLSDVRVAFREIDELLLEPDSEESRQLDVVNALCAAAELRSTRHHATESRHVLPGRRLVEEIVDELRGVLFPWHFGPEDLTSLWLKRYLNGTLDRVREKLSKQVRRCLVFDCQHVSRERVLACTLCERRALDSVEQLIASLPRIRALLETDAKAAYDGDPAVRYLDEVLLAYPGMTAITHHRIAHELQLLGIPLLPRLVSELAHERTGIDIHPGAEIGASFFIDHGTGVVIGETCSIGERVRLHQAVTLGGRGAVDDEQERLLKGIPRHPIVEDDVVIHAGATVLGRITIGRGATIGGNVWLTRSVAPGERVTQAHARHRTFGDGSGI